EGAVHGTTPFIASSRSRLRLGHAGGRGARSGPPPVHRFLVIGPPPLARGARRPPGARPGEARPATPAGASWSSVLEAPAAPSPAALGVSKPMRRGRRAPRKGGRLTVRGRGGPLTAVVPAPRAVPRASPP